MKRPDLTFALRALQTELSSSAFWVFAGGVAVILALSGPFGTIDALAPLPRFAYWLGVVLVTYMLGFLTSVSLMRTVAGLSFALRVFLQGSAVSLFVAPFIEGLNHFVFGARHETWADCAIFVGILWMICLGVAAIMLVTHPISRTFDRAQQDMEQSPPLIQQLPMEKRGALVSISAEDHHVRITTTNGEHWIRMRLSDAIVAARPVTGLQVHRSHWVSTSAIASVAREGKRGLLTMSHGPTIPVSRPQMQTLRDEGLLV